MLLAWLKRRFGLRLAARQSVQRIGHDNFSHFSLFQWKAEMRSPKQPRAGHVPDIVVMPHYPSAK
jgi:hypothetical protein